MVGNGVLTEMLRELSTRSAVITMLYQSRRDAACSSEEHREFIEAARAGDTERAVALMVEHLGHVEGALHFEELPAARAGTQSPRCWPERAAPAGAAAPLYVALDLRQGGPGRHRR